MDPDRVRSYLQVACAGLGFDIGEVWWMSNENGTSTVASITETPQDSSTTASMQRQPNKRFLQLYTSKAYGAQRSKLVQPHEEAEIVNSEDEDEDTVTDGTTVNDPVNNTDNNSQLVPHNKNVKQQHISIDEEEHVLSPRIVEAVTKSAHVVWANCQSEQQNGGLLGRSDIKLQTAIGMPVGIDEAGHVWVVVMFSPKNIQSSTDAIEYLQYIGRSAAGNSNIPCLLPVVGDNVVGIGSGGPKLIGNGKKEEDGTKITTNVEQQSHYLVPIQPPQISKQLSNTVQTQDILGEGVTAKFVSFNIQDDEYVPESNTLDSQQLAMHHPRANSIHSVNDLRDAPKDDFGIPMLPADNYENSDNILVIDDFDEASYGVWSTIMNSASGNTIRTSTTIASKLGIIRERLEEFLCAFLGMSMFDVGDAWVLSSADGEGVGNARDDKKRTLKCLFTAAATENNQGINAFRGISEKSSIQSGDGAIGKAFSSGYPVWSSDKALIYDSTRHQALENCNIETIFAVPIFSAGDVSPSCILSCYSLIHAESVPFVVNFVQKAVWLLWDGLDRIKPHESVGQELWKNVGPSDLGEMAADVEMQKTFIRNKRPRGASMEVIERAHIARNTNLSAPEAAPVSWLSAAQISDQNHFNSDTSQSKVSYNVPPVKGLSPAPVFPTSVTLPKEHQPASINVNHPGIVHWAVQQAVESVGDFQSWNSAQDVNQFSNGVPQEQVIYQKEQNKAPIQQQGQFSYPKVPTHVPQVQPLQYHPEFINTGDAQFHQQQASLISQNNSAQPFLQPNSLAYVDYGVQSATDAADSTHVAGLSLPAGIHIDPPPVIQANLMEFNAMAQMYINPETSHPPNNTANASMNFASVAPAPAQSDEFRNMRIVPFSQAEGSVILTEPQKFAYCSPNPPVCVQSIDEQSFDLNASKECRITGCSEQAQSRKPYCSKHSGNRQCERQGCAKHAQGATRFCIAHGGGRRCTHPGCDKGARDRYFCAAHGGGKRCKLSGCSKSAVGGSNFCTSHGGGKRCKVEGCDKSAQSSTDFCVKHGGGKKCQFEGGCEKVARGRTLFCAAHGGGIRCKLEGCNRVAIGKAQLCRAHGGGTSKNFPTFAFTPFM